MCRTCSPLRMRLGAVAPWQHVRGMATDPPPRVTRAAVHRLAGAVEERLAGASPSQIATSAQVLHTLAWRGKRTYQAIAAQLMERLGGGASGGANGGAAAGFSVGELSALQRVLRARLPGDASGGGAAGDGEQEELWQALHVAVGAAAAAASPKELLAYALAAGPEWEASAGSCPPSVAEKLLALLSTSSGGAAGGADGGADGAPQAVLPLTQLAQLAARGWAASKAAADATAPSGDSHQEGSTSDALPPPTAVLSALLCSRVACDALASLPLAQWGAPEWDALSALAATVAEACAASPPAPLLARMRELLLDAPAAALAHCSAGAVAQLVWALAVLGALDLGLWDVLALALDRPGQVLGEQTLLSQVSACGQRDPPGRLWPGCWG